MVTGRSTAAQAEREEAAPSKSTNNFESTKKGQAWPSHFVGENKGPKGEQTSTRAAHTHGGKAINREEKMAKHTSNRRKGEESLREPSTKQTKQKHDPSHDVERHTEGRAAPKKTAHTHCRKRRQEETSAKLTSKQKGAGRRTAARAKRKEAAPGGKASNLTSTNMIRATAWDETGDEMANKPK